MQPWFLHTSSLYGTIGSFAFKDATPEACDALLAAFEPAPLVLTRGDFTSARPAGYSKEGERLTSTQEIQGGVVLRMDRTANYPHRSKVEWYTRLGGGLIQMSVELENIHGITPNYAASVQYDSTHQHIVSVSNARPEFLIKPVQKLEYVRYSAGSRDGFGTLLIYGNVRAYIEQLAGYCYSQRRASKKAYQEDKIAGLTPVRGPASDQTYDSAKLRAGTREQYECLNSEEARRDMALADKHWKAYAEDYGVETTQGYFSHYDWACAYLKRQGLYEVPDPRDPSKTYKYGHAWL
jgi:hypothetical protein